MFAPSFGPNRHPGRRCLALSMALGVLLAAAISQGPARAQTTPTETATILEASANPAPAGKPVTLKARVTATGGTPTGTVAFQAGAGSLGSAALSPEGSATLDVSTLAVGRHTITAVYGGSAEFAGSASAPLVQVIDKAATTVTVTASPNPGTVGQPVTITARVSIGKGEQGFGLAVQLEGNLPEVEPDTAMALMQAAHQICPYSNATRGNIDVALSVAQAALGDTAATAAEHQPSV